MLFRESFHTEQELATLLTIKNQKIQLRISHLAFKHHQEEFLTSLSKAIL